MSRAVIAAAVAVGVSACALVADIERFERAADAPAAVDGAGPIVAPTDGGGDAPSLVGGDGAAQVDAPPTPCGDCSGQCQSDGVCILASGLAGPRTIALVGGLVVFAEESAGRARACPQSGCSPTGPVVVRAGLTTPRVMRPELGGGKPALIDQGGAGIFELLSNGTASEVTTQSPFAPLAAQLSDSILGVVTSAGIYMCPRGGGFPSGCSQLGGSTRPTLALSGSVVIWAGANSGIATYDTASPDPVGVPNQTANGGALASLLAADQSAVHGIAGNGLYTWPLDGNTATFLADVPDMPSGLSVDSGHIYLAGKGVRVVDKNSGQVVTRFPGRTTIDVVASAQYLFWLEAGELARAPK